MHHDIASYLTKLVGEHSGANNGIVFNGNFAGKFGGIADDAIITYNTIMCNVHIFHQQTVAPNYRFSFRCRSARYGNILSDAVVISNFAS